jgi:hypothetical protein
MILIQAESRTLSLEEKVYSMPPFRPGTVYVQSLPFSRLADRIIASAPKAGGDSRVKEAYWRIREFTGWRQSFLKYHNSTHDI